MEVFLSFIVFDIRKRSMLFFMDRGEKEVPSATTMILCVHLLTCTVCMCQI